MKRSTRARAQQAIWIMRRAAMQRRNEASLDMLKDSCILKANYKQFAQEKEVFCTEKMKWLVIAKITEVGRESRVYMKSV
jgi:hypothetical protein